MDPPTRQQNPSWNNIFIIECFCLSGITYKAKKIHNEQNELDEVNTATHLQMWVKLDV